MRIVSTIGALPASIPSPPAEWASVSLGPLTLYTYALCILAGIVLALLLTVARWKRRGGNPDVIWDVAIWAIPFGILGGRLYHVFSSPDAYFGPDGDLARIPRIWEGGLGIWGAIALGAVGAWIGCRRSGVRLSAFADAAAPGILLAQAIGRLGNWFNQELFGAPTTLPWGLEIDPDNANFPDGVPIDTLFHPTFLYEMLWNLAGVALLLLLDKRFGLRGGMMFWAYAAYYTAGRVWIEALRIDDAELITLFGVTQRLNVWTSILVLLGAIAVLIYLGVKRKGAATPSLYLPGREPVVEGADAEADSGSDMNAGPDAHVTDTEETKPTTRGNLVETNGSQEHLPETEETSVTPREKDSRP